MSVMHVPVSIKIAVYCIPSEYTIYKQLDPMTNEIAVWMET